MIRDRLVALSASIRKAAHMVSSASLAGIQNYRAVDDRLGTAGQPVADQFRAVREDGFEVVVNLALPTSDNALADEGSIVTGLGMSYVHIPVNFENPTPRDFELFCRVMDSFARHRVFIHCAANKRVSAFVFLSRVLRCGIDVSDAEKDLRAIWEPDEAWARFIAEQLRNRTR
jgi:protein tyrosine phosphatase (PTP) superfamily phosphohydrolase (DUF442 family)